MEYDLPSSQSMNGKLTSPFELVQGVQDGLGDILKELLWLFFGMYHCRIIFSFFAVKMDKMKNIQNFMLNYVLFYHFPEKTCWKKVIQHFNFLSLAAMAVMTTSRNILV